MYNIKIPKKKKKTMSKPNIGLNNQEIAFSHSESTIPPVPNYTGAVIQMESEGSMQSGPSFQSVKAISQFVNGKLHGDSYVDESTSRETYTIYTHENGETVSENTFKGGSNHIREFRENHYDENPNSILDKISSLDAESEMKVIDRAEVTKRNYSTILNIPHQSTSTAIKVHTENSSHLRFSSADHTSESKNIISDVYFTAGNINLKEINAEMASDLATKFSNTASNTESNNTHSDKYIDSVVREFEDKHATDLDNFTTANNTSLQAVDDAQLADVQRRDFEIQIEQLPNLKEVLKLTYPDAFPHLPGSELDGDSIKDSNWYKKTNALPRKSPQNHWITNYFDDLTSIPTNQKELKNKYILDEFNIFKDKIKNSDLSDVEKSIIETMIGTQIINKSDLNPTHKTLTNTIELSKYRVLDFVLGNKKQNEFKDKLDEIKTSYSGSLSMPNAPNNNLSYKNVISSSKKWR